MPQAYVKELAKKHNISISAAEDHWNMAKKAAEKEGHGEDYAYVTGIFKKMMGESVTTIKESAKDKVLRAVILVQEAKVQQKLRELKASSFKEFLINEAGPFSYGSKKPKSAHAKEVDKKVKDYVNQHNKDFEIKDDMVGVAKKTKVKESADNPGIGDFIKFDHNGDKVEGKVSRIGKDADGKKFYTTRIVAGPQKGKVVSVPADKCS